MRCDCLVTFVWDPVSRIHTTQKKMPSKNFLLPRNVLLSMHFAQPFSGWERVKQLILSHILSTRNYCLTIGWTQKTSCSIVTKKALDMNAFYSYIDEKCQFVQSHIFWHSFPIYKFIAWPWVEHRRRVAQFSDSNQHWPPFQPSSTDPVLASASRTMWHVCVFS